MTINQTLHSENPQTLILSRLASFLPFFEVISEIFINFAFAMKDSPDTSKSK